MTSKKEENSNSLDATSVTPIHLMIHDVMNVLEYETRYLLVNNSEEFSADSCRNGPDMGKFRKKM